MPVPFLGRLNPTEYVALVGSFILVGLEAWIRVLTLALPASLINLCYRASRRVFNLLTSPAQKRAELRKQSISTNVRNASDFVDLCALHGYYAEEHVMQTKDGYLLGLHRLAWRKGEDAATMKVNQGPNSTRKRVVYMHHGLLMNSEVWVCLTDAQRCLPFTLVEMGFDVWFGNNRGNKYSKKSVKFPPTSPEFWNFSMDEFAFHDIPDAIEYVLSATNQASLSYIGFSQGTAQGFATLSIHPRLNDKVDVFIALAPAMSPAGLATGVVDSLVKTSPSILFLLFGRRSILASATMWESILYPPIFVRAIDGGLRFLFNWHAKNISLSQKLAAYPHLYSFTSTKSVVHWFQIMRNKCFQMYDDDVHPPITLTTASKYTKVAKYPTRNIRTPVVLVYGGSDSLVDIEIMLHELPPQTVATEIPHYEHLDFLWARDVEAQVFPHVFDALDSFKGAEHTKEEYERYRNARVHSLNASNTLRLTRHRHTDSDTVNSDDARAGPRQKEQTNGNGSGNGNVRGSSAPTHIARETQAPEKPAASAAQDNGPKSPVVENVSADKQKLPATPITATPAKAPAEESPATAKSPDGGPPGPATNPLETETSPDSDKASIRSNRPKSNSVRVESRGGTAKGGITVGASSPASGVQTTGAEGLVSPSRVPGLANRRGRA